MSEKINSSPDNADASNPWEILRSQPSNPNAQADKEAAMPKHEFDGFTMTVENPSGLGVEGIDIPPMYSLKIKHPGIESYDKGDHLKKVEFSFKRENGPSDTIVRGYPLLNIDLKAQHPTVSRILLVDTSSSSAFYGEDLYKIGNEERRSNFAMVTFDRKGKNVAFSYLKCGRGSQVMVPGELMGGEEHEGVFVGIDDPDGSVTIKNNTPGTKICIQELGQNLEGIKSINRTRQGTKEQDGSYSLNAENLRPLTNSHELAKYFGIDGEIVAQFNRGDGSTGDAYFADTSDGLVVIEDYTKNATSLRAGGSVEWSGDYGATKRIVSLTEDGKINIKDRNVSHHPSSDLFTVLRDEHVNHYRFTPPYRVVEKPKPRERPDGPKGLLARDPSTRKIMEYKNGQYRDTGLRY